MDPTRPQLLRALAHPLRARLLMELRDAPATSAVLARRTGQTRGNVSYHLRALARADLIDEDVDTGTARERWWRAAALPEVQTSDLRDDEHAAAAALAVAQERGRRLARFAERLGTGEVAPERAAAARVSDIRLELSAAQQVELVTQIDALLARWVQAAGGPADDAESVEVQLAVFSVAHDG